MGTGDSRLHKQAPSRREITGVFRGKLQAFSERYGNIGKVLWQVDFDNLAALDKYQASFDSDQGYWALVNKSADLLVEDSVMDTVYETL